MEAIIFFTKPGKLNHIGYASDWQPFITPVLPFYYYQTSTIIIVFDGIQDNDNEINDKIVTSLNEILENIEQLTNVFLIYHNETIETIRTSVIPFCTQKNIQVIQKEAHNIHNTNSIYEEAGSIVCTKNVTKDIYDKIKKKLDFDELLEAKLNLLHQCLNKDYTISDTDKNSILTLLLEGEEKTKLSDALNKYSPNGVHHNNLTTLRNALLPD